MKVKIEVDSVEGRCAAGYRPGDASYLNGFLLESEKPLCIHATLALAHVAYALTHGMDRNSFGKEKIYLSCPDPGEPYGDGKVIFRLEVIE